MGAAVLAAVAVKEKTIVTAIETAAAAETATATEIAAVTGIVTATATAAVTETVTATETVAVTETVIETETVTTAAAAEDRKRVPLLRFQTLVDAQKIRRNRCGKSKRLSGNRMGKRKTVGVKRLPFYSVARLRIV